MGCRILLALACAVSSVSCARQAATPSAWLWSSRIDGNESVIARFDTIYNDARGVASSNDSALLAPVVRWNRMLDSAALAVPATHTVTDAWTIGRLIDSMRVAAGDSEYTVDRWQFSPIGNDAEDLKCDVYRVDRFGIVLLQPGSHHGSMLTRIIWTNGATTSAEPLARAIGGRLPSIFLDSL
jgi:hypothetical protein